MRRAGFSHFTVCNVISAETPQKNFDPRCKKNYDPRRQKNYDPRCKKNMTRDVKGPQGALNVC